MVLYPKNQNSTAKSEICDYTEGSSSQFLSPKDIARILQVNYHKVLDLINIGEIKAFRVGGVYRISPTDFENYLQSVEVEVFSLSDIK